MENVRTRFAPSPTGTPDSIHLGFVIRALWNYAFAKKNDGQFILRIEDTDQKRSRKETEDAILATLKEFGIGWDEGPDIGGPHAPYRQSERLDKYQKAAHELVEKGFAYYDFDAAIREKEQIKEAYKSKEKLAELKVRPRARDLDPQDAKKRADGGEPYVVRAKIPEDKKFKYKDWILKKEIEFLGKEVQDMILLKSDGFPTYHLAVVVDDVEMEISHVFRGQEWISSTPIHLHIYEGLGHKVPEIGHFTVVLDPRTLKKFSKRDITALFGVKTWLENGYLPEAILNYLMLLGWAPKDNRELFTLDEFVKAFDQDGVQKANPIFNTDKLDWFNGHYIRQKSDKELSELLVAFLPEGSDKKILEKVTPLIKERIKKLSDIGPFAGFFFESPAVDKDLLGKNYTSHLEDATKIIESLGNWSLEELNEKLMNTIKDKGYKTGDFFMDLRIAITGRKFTPPINESILILGKDKALKRLKALL